MKILSRDLFLLSVSTKSLMVTFTINVIEPEGTTVTLIADGYTQEGNSIKVPIGTVVTWSITKTGYTELSDSHVVTGNTTLYKRLTDLPTCTITVKPVPADAYVSIKSFDGEWDSKGKKGLTVPVGTELNIEVSDPELNTYKTTIYAQEDETLDVVLENTITIVPTPDDASVFINGVSGTTKIQRCNAVVDWEVSRVGYVTKRETIHLNGRGIVPNHTLDERGDKRLYVELEKQPYAMTFRVSHPLDATVTAQVNDGEVITALNEVTVNAQIDDVIKWSASKEGYVTKEGEFVVAGPTQPDPIMLEIKKYLVSIKPTPETAVVTIESEGEVLVSGEGSQRVNVEEGTPIRYMVQKGTVLKTGELIVATEDIEIEVQLSVGDLVIDVMKYDRSVLSGLAGYPVYANDNTIAISTDAGELAFFEPTGDTLTLRNKVDNVGCISGAVSLFETSAEKQVYYSVQRDTTQSGYVGFARKVTINPNNNTCTISDETQISPIVGGGKNEAVLLSGGWLHYEQSGNKLKVYFNSVETYSYYLYQTTPGVSVSGYVQLPHWGKRDANSVIGRKGSVGLYTTTEVIDLYYDFSVTDCFVDDNGNIAAAGAGGFIIIDGFLKTKIFSYSNTNSQRGFRLLGRINEYYYVISHPYRNSTSNNNAILYVFYADGSGLKDTKEIVTPGWLPSGTTATVEDTRVVPQVSQTGYLTFISASGNFGYNNPYVIRIQGY